jgi:hypothetical protein
MMTLPLRFLLVGISSVAYLALAILGWGGVVAFFSHPALVALTVAFFILVGVAFLAGGNVSPGTREDRSNRWVLVAFGIIGLLDGFLPAVTDRRGIWTLEVMRSAGSA